MKSILIVLLLISPSYAEDMTTTGACEDKHMPTNIACIPETTLKYDGCYWTCVSTQEKTPDYDKEIEKLEDHIDKLAHAVQSINYRLDLLYKECKNLDYLTDILTQELKGEK